MAEQRNLDPSVPADAIQIINVLTADLTLSRRNTEVFNAALATLAKAVTPDQKVTGEPNA